MLRFSVISILAFIVFINCSDDNPTDSESNLLTLEMVEGNYLATELSINDNGNVIDLLELGVSLKLTLKDDYTTEGDLFVPDTMGLLDDDIDGDVNIDLTGTFLFSGDTLKFSHNSDTYIRDANWFYYNGKIYTEDYVHSVLVKQ